MILFSIFPETLLKVSCVCLFVTRTSSGDDFLLQSSSSTFSFYKRPQRRDQCLVCRFCACGPPPIPPHLSFPFFTHRVSVRVPPLRTFREPPPEVGKRFPGTFRGDLCVFFFPFLIFPGRDLPSSLCSPPPDPRVLAFLSDRDRTPFCFLPPSPAPSPSYYLGGFHHSDVQMLDGISENPS